MVYINNKIAHLLGNRFFISAVYVYNVEFRTLYLLTNSYWYRYSFTNFLIYG